MPAAPYEVNPKSGVGYLSVAANPSPASNVICVSQPVRYTFDPAIEQTNKLETNRLGEEGHGGFTRKGAMPKFQTIFSKGRSTPALRQWVYHNTYAEATVTLPLTRTVYLPTGSGNYEIPAATSGQLGHGMVANIANAATMQRITSEFPELSNQQLTRTPYEASPGALGTRTFQQGANGAYWFSADLRGYMVSITWEQASVKTVRKSENAIGSYKLTLLVPTEGNWYEVYVVDDAEVIVGATDDPQADSLEINWQCKLSGVDRCKAFDHFFTSITAVC